MKYMTENEKEEKREKKRILFPLIVIILLLLILGIGVLILMGDKKDDTPSEKPEEKTEVTIKYYIDDTLFEEDTVKNNAVVNIPEATEKPGYRFDWYVDYENKVKFYSEYLIDNEVKTDVLEVHGIYEEIIPEEREITIKYYIDNTLFVEDTVKDNAVVNIPEVTEKPGYRFDDWYVDYENKVKFYSEYLIDNEVKTDVLEVHGIYKEIIPNQYKVSFIANIVDINIPNLYLSEIKEADLPKLEVPENFESVNFYLDEEHKQPLTTPYKLSEDITIYVYFKPITYKINYHNTENAYNPNPVIYDVTSVIELKAIELRGYKFLGWYANESLEGEPVKIIENMTGEINLYAKFELAKYTITYKSSENIFESYEEEYDIFSNITLKPKEVVGYRFLGWYDNINFNGKPITNISNRTGNITLYAKYEKITANIIYSPREMYNENPPILTIDFFADHNGVFGYKLKDPRRPDYKFLGWYTDSSYNNKIEILTEVKEYRLYAKFERETSKYLTEENNSLFKIVILKKDYFNENRNNFAKLNLFTDSI